MLADFDEKQLFMVSNIVAKDISEVYRTPVLQQTAFWSKVKNRQGLSSIALNFKANKNHLVTNGTADDSYIESDLLILIKQIDSVHSIAYLPYGPELEPKDEDTGVFLEELSEQIRPFLPNNCIMIRYDLAWRSLWASEDEHFDHNGNWLGPPDSYFQELRVNMETKNWNFRKAASNVLPTNTIFVNLENQEDMLLKKMKPKTRYNISLAIRRGVEVKVHGMESLDIWYNLYKETAIRNSFMLHSLDYFKIILTEKANDTNSPAEVLLLIAEYDGNPLAAMFLVISDNRATYLYGASTSYRRNLMATYAVQWRAMTIAKERGCVEYDMFGVSPGCDESHPMHGLFRFKSGFGGELHHSMGCWDYPLDNEVYACYVAAEKSHQGYHV